MPILDEFDGTSHLSGLAAVREVCGEQQQRDRCFEPDEGLANADLAAWVLEEQVFAHHPLEGARLGVELGLMAADDAGARIADPGRHQVRIVVEGIQLGC